MTIQVPPLIHAVVVTYQRPDSLTQTLAAVQQQTLPPASYTVVDNGADPVVEELTRGLCDATYLPMPCNVGPAGAVAAGMSAVMERAHDDDVVLLVDDDDPPAAADLLERLALPLSLSEPAIGAIGATGSRFNRRRGRLVRVLDEELKSATGLVDVDYIGSNSYPLYVVRALREVGVFDKSLFFGFEELEFGLRLRSRGWPVVIDPHVTLDVRALHNRLNLGDRVPRRAPQPAWRRYYSARNLLEVTRRYGSPTASAQAALGLGFGAGARAAVLSHDAREAWPAWKGTVDGLRRRSGRTVDPGWEP